MKNLIRFILAAVFLVHYSSFVAAESGLTRTDLFNTYAEGRAELDSLIKGRQFEEAFERFSTPSADSQFAISELEKSLTVEFSEDFENAALVRSIGLKNGFRQELIAYWTNDNYIFVYLFLHANKDALQLLDFRIAPDINELNRFF